MIRHLFLATTALLVTLVAWFSLSHRENRADLTYVNPSGIHTLDPARMSWTQDFRVALNLWEGLTALDPKTLKPIGGVAYFPPAVSNDGLVYTFRIRDDARWSSGDPVTSYDFKRGWRRAMEPGTAADYAFLFTDNIAGAKEYVIWRSDTVNTLGVLRYFDRGGTISADQMKLFVRHPVFLELRKAAMPQPAPPSADSDDAAWKTFSLFYRNWRLDWHEWAAHVRNLHANELDDRFARVGIETPDEKTLVVRLTKPCPYFLDLTAFATFLPIHESIDRLRSPGAGSAITAEGLVVYDPQWTKPNYHRNAYPGLITNGPYRLFDWTFKRRARFVINPFFHGANEIQCRTIDMLEYDNVSASIMAYEAGDADFLTDLGVPYQHELVRLARSGERPDFKTCNVLATQFLSFNCISDTIDGVPNPFNDSRVRRAFTLGTDRARIVEKVLTSGDRVAHSFVPSGALPGYTPPPGLSYDIRRARELLKEAGYATGESLGPIELLTTSTNVRLSEALAKMWEDALGVRVELRVQESKTFAEDKSNHHFMIAQASWYADYNDPTTFLECLASGNGNNDAGYASNRYDEALQLASNTTDPTTRMVILRQAEAILLQQDCPILPISHSSQLIAIKPYVTGLHPNARLLFPFRYVSVSR